MEDAEKLAAKMAKGKFDLDDLWAQLKQMQCNETQQARDDFPLQRSVAAASSTITGVGRTSQLFGHLHSQFDVHHREAETTSADMRWRRVPRYFFDLYDDLIVPDDEGQELPDPTAAEQAAIRNARQIASAQVLDGRLNLDHRIEVRAETGDLLLTLYFKDVIDVTGGGR